MNDKDFVENEAVLVNNTPIDHTDCEKCMDDYIFKMKDNYHEFAITLDTVISLIGMCERSGVLPTLPKAWWIKVHGRYEPSWLNLENQ